MEGGPAPQAYADPGFPLEGNGCDREMDLSVSEE